ncbi:hypothetical protein WQ54_00020 [Bacillus sp. SA1-12]|uniref:hypothetical protein n=1 Tax=Bacillus sp. SA1-12 TaxID=1455638 RepID=UPI00062555A6|nr:hypothetical protein [Bacillus sp. SA1-12]KKI93972.1 hypothetical protein WQ54_00020 [Bacillus sp. SA1-12]
MNIRVVAKKDHGKATKIYFLNLTEPKHQQLYMAIMDDSVMNILTVYNLKSNMFEDVTCLFSQSFLLSLSHQLLNQLRSPQAKAL